MRRHVNSTPAKRKRGARKQPGKRTFDPWQTEFPEPEFDPRELVSKFESDDDMVGESEKRQKALRGGGHEAHRRLAAQLASCNPDEPCLSAACPHCVRRFRIWYIAEMLRCLDDHLDLISVTIIDNGHVVPNELLHTVNPRRLKNSLRKQMGRINSDDTVQFGNVPIMGGIDGDYLEATERWRPHFHLVAPASTRPAFRELRNRFYRSSDETHKPFFINRVRHRAKQVSYCFKGYWEFKPRIKDSVKHAKPRRLEGPQYREWLLWRDRFDIADFMFLYGARRYGDAIQLQASVIDKNQSKP